MSRLIFVFTFIALPVFYMPVFACSDFVKTTLHRPGSPRVGQASSGFHTSNFNIYDLSAEARRILINAITEDTMDVAALAQNILNLNVVNHGPHNILIMLQVAQIRESAHLLAEKLQWLPSIKNKEIQEWLAATKEENIEFITEHA